MEGREHVRRRITSGRRSASHGPGGADASSPGGRARCVGCGLRRVWRVVWGRRWCKGAWARDAWGDVFWLFLRSGMGVVWNQVLVASPRA